MQTVYVDGVPIEDFSTRAEALVYCFERNLVYDRFNAKRNTLLPNVKIKGTDDAEPTIYPSRHPLDSARIQNSSGSKMDGQIQRSSRKHTGRPKRGPLDDRSDDPSPRRVKDINGKWRRL